MGRAGAVRSRGVALLAAGVVLAAGCSGGEQQSAPVDPKALADAVQLDAVTSHLAALERIAADNGGNRALGTAGYDASVDYVVDLLGDAGFDVRTPEFDTTSFEVDHEELAVDGSPMEVRALGLSPSTGRDGLTARAVRIAPDDTPGCEESDYDSADAAGAVVIVDRGVCTFALKEQIAAEQGAAALLVANNEDGPLVGAGLGADAQPRIPVGGVAGPDVDRLAAASTVTLTLATRTEKQRSRNVVTQTRTGSTDDVVVVGAHLDSVPEGPGINDNGTGVAAVLETALQLGSEPGVENAVRFAFWGAEEVGLVGSSSYVESLSEDERQDIALYLNFDMLGSPNSGYLVFDGDDSDAVGEGPGPEGSAGIERTFARYFDERGIAVVGTDFDGRSDYGPFVALGIPSGGVFTGADEVKTAEEAVRWGGVADEPFDPNYHTPDDVLADIDRAALAAAASAVAYGTGAYAMSVEGPDGVPTGEQRVRVRAEFTE